MRFFVWALTSLLGTTAAFSPSFMKPKRQSCRFSSSQVSAVMSKLERVKQFGRRRPTRISKRLTFEYENFETAMDDFTYDFEYNNIVKGVCVEYADRGCYVDIGAKGLAFLPNEEASLFPISSKSLEGIINLEEEMDFQIISDEDDYGELLVSIKRLQYREAWEEILAMQAADQVFESEIVEVNRGGCICMVRGIQAFLPGSHMSGMLPSEDMVGSVLQLKFLEVNQEMGKVVVSNRKAVVEEQMANLSRGDVVSGMVKALKPYGAFVEVGNMSGLLHISQISYDRIDDLEQVLQPGMPVKCMIIDHDKINGRIALGTKTLEPEPGDMLKDSQMVFERAEETARKYHERMEAERKAREEAAHDIVTGLGNDSLDDFGVSGDIDSITSDPLAEVSDSLDSLLS